MNRGDRVHGFVFESVLTFGYLSICSKTLQRAMKDMISHNYDRFAKVGSSSAFSGFMARE